MTLNFKKIIFFIANTFFMSKSKYGKKVLKTVVGHGTCRTCHWWRQNRPDIPVGKHRCVQNHDGSARSMESSTCLKGVKELIDEGTLGSTLERIGTIRCLPVYDLNWIWKWISVLTKTMWWKTFGGVCFLYRRKKN